jgi:hypothetical protein
MNRVTGIGGFFFRSKHPETLAQWYKDHLGIDLVPTDYSQRPWFQEAGPTVFAAGDGRTAVRFQIERDRPAAPEHGR